MIYIQADKQGRPHHHEAACTMFGAIETKQEFKLITYDELADDSGLWDWRTVHCLFVGTVEFMKEVWKIRGVDPWIPNNPSRSHKLMTLDEAKAKITPTKNLFIKPKELKLFTGFVLDESHYKCLDDVPGDTELLTYKPFKKEIISEWRIYVQGNEIIDCKHYSGEFDAFPNMDYIGETIGDYNLLYNKESWNKCYTIDIAIMVDKSQEIIELNDMWAIGNYGVPNDIYLDLLKYRYFGIIKDGR